jgi:hypothetical protein
VVNFVGKNGGGEVRESNDNDNDSNICRHF